MFTTRHAFLATSALLIFGTAYSVLYGTYLDTSDPLHTVHPLSGTHYWASKNNFINIYFIKRAWGWTSLAFFGLYFSTTAAERTTQSLLRWISATTCWLIFTSWFFGPAILERVLVASGAECLVRTPSGQYIDVPHEYCYSRTTLSPATHPDLFISPLSLPEQWTGTPKLRRGHDVSGHIFLLTLSILFLVDQLQPALRRIKRSPLQSAVVVANLLLVCIWLFSVLITSVYFHAPIEKISGYWLSAFAGTLQF